MFWFHPYEYKKSELSLLMNELKQKTRTTIYLLNPDMEEMINLLVGRNKNGFVFKHSTPTKTLKDCKWTITTCNDLDEFINHVHEYIVKNIKNNEKITDKNKKLLINVD